MLYEKIETLAGNLDAAADVLDMMGEDANPGVVMAYRAIAEMLRQDLEAENSLFKDVAEFSSALSDLSQVEPNVGARTAYTLVVGRLDGILWEHA